MALAWGWNLMQMAWAEAVKNVGFATDDLTEFLLV